jgi:hypothetical protein
LLSEPSLLFEDVCADQSQHRQSIQFGHFAVLIATTDEVIDYLNLCCNALCLLLALSGYSGHAQRCPLLG